MPDTFGTYPVRTIHVWLDGDGWHREETDHRPPGNDDTPGGGTGGVVRIVVDDWDVT